MGEHARAAAPRTGTRRIGLIAASATALAVLAGSVLVGVGSAAEPTATGAAAPTGSHGAALVRGTPCTVTARACVDLAKQRAWLIEDGVIERGPVGMSAGDDETPTPVGTFRVQWKAKEYTSREYLTQMPYSVFWADGGVAFHEGRQDTHSGGCVKLVHDDAVAFFDYLQVGDQVQVH